jgi:proteasome accessory factor B
LETISAAIGSSDYLIFDYLSPSLSAEAREIVPIALSNKSGFWYVSGVDKGVEEVRTFRLDRVQGAITVRKNKEHFEFPSEFELDQIHAASAVRFAKIDVRKGKGHALRALATSVTDLGEWDQIKVPIYTVEYLTAQILWHGDDVFVHEPADLRENVVKQLQELVVNHE